MAQRKHHQNPQQACCGASRNCFVTRVSCQSAAKASKPYGKCRRARGSGTPQSGRRCPGYRAIPTLAEEHREERPNAIDVAGHRALTHAKPWRNMQKGERKKKESLTSKPNKALTNSKITTGASHHNQRSQNQTCACNRLHRPQCKCTIINIRKGHAVAPPATAS